MRVLVALAAVVTVASVATGCSGGGSPAPPPTDTSSAAVSSSAATSPAPTRSAWVRGTHVVLTNNLGRTIQVRSQVAGGQWSSKESLPSGSSVTATDEWSGGRYTIVILGLTLPAGDDVNLKFTNPPIGSPGFRYCDGKDCDVWRADENQTRTVTITTSGGAKLADVTVTRGSDDDDNKNWTAVLIPAS